MGISKCRLFPQVTVASSFIQNKIKQFSARGLEDPSINIAYEQRWTVCNTLIDIIIIIIIWSSSSNSSINILFPLVSGDSFLSRFPPET